MAIALGTLWSQNFISGKNIQEFRCFPTLLIHLAANVPTIKLNETNRKFMAYLIKKHKINVTKHERDSAEGNQHIANCGTNYQAYFTYK